MVAPARTSTTMQALRSRMAFSPSPPPLKAFDPAEEPLPGRSRRHQRRGEATRRDGDGDGVDQSIPTKGSAKMGAAEGSRRLPLAEKTTFDVGNHGSSSKGNVAAGTIAREEEVVVGITLQARQGPPTLEEQVMVRKGKEHEVEKAQPMPAKEMSNEKEEAKLSRRNPPRSIPTFRIQLQQKSKQGAGAEGKAAKKKPSKKTQVDRDVSPTAAARPRPNRTSMQTQSRAPPAEKSLAQEPQTEEASLRLLVSETQEGSKAGAEETGGRTEAAASTAFCPSDHLKPAKGGAVERPNTGESKNRGGNALEKTVSASSTLTAGRKPRNDPVRWSPPTAEASTKSAPAANGPDVAGKDDAPLLGDNPVIMKAVAGNVVGAKATAVVAAARSQEEGAGFDGGHKLPVIFPPSLPESFAAWDRKDDAGSGDDLVYCDPTQFSAQRDAEDKEGIEGCISFGRLGTDLPPSLISGGKPPPSERETLHASSPTPAASKASFLAPLHSTPLLKRPTGNAPRLVQPVVPIRSQAELRERERLFNLESDDEDVPLVLSVRRGNSTATEDSREDSKTAAPSFVETKVESKSRTRYGNTLVGTSAPPMDSVSIEDVFGFSLAEKEVQPKLKEKKKRANGGHETGSQERGRENVAVVMTARTEEEGEKEKHHGAPEDENASDPLDEDAESLPPLPTLHSREGKGVKKRGGQESGHKVTIEPSSELTDLDSDLDYLLPTRNGKRKRGKDAAEVLRPLSVNEVLAYLPGNPMSPLSSVQDGETKASKGGVKRMSRADGKMTLKRTFDDDERVAKTPKPRKKRVLTMDKEDSLTGEGKSLAKKERGKTVYKELVDSNEFDVLPGSAEVVPDGARGGSGRAKDGQAKRQRQSQGGVAALRKGRRGKEVASIPVGTDTDEEEEWDALPHASKRAKQGAKLKVGKREGKVQTQTAVTGTEGKSRQTKASRDSEDEEDSDQARERNARAAAFKEIDETGLNVELV